MPFAGREILRLFPVESDRSTEIAAIDYCTKHKLLYVDLYQCTPAGGMVIHCLPKHNFPAFMIDGADEVVLDNHRFPCPRHPKRMLQNRYGKNWRVPMPAAEYEKQTDEVIEPFGPQTAYLQGGWDLFHPGHVRLLQRAAKLFDRVVVGVDSAANAAAFGQTPVMFHVERIEVVRACRFVDEVIEDPPPKKDLTIQWLDDHKLDWLVNGDDSYVQDLLFPLLAQDRVHVMPRTPGVSTSDLKDRLKKSC